MSEVGISKYVYLYLLILLVTLGAGNSHAQGLPNGLETKTRAQSVNDLRLSIDTPAQNYKDSNTFQLSIFFENRGKEKIIILPESIHRNYQAKGQGAAKYIPFPGPRISPWRDAFPLLPGRKNEIKLVGMRDRDGVWVLEPETYNLSIQYIVPRDLISAYTRDFPNSQARLWTGSIESGRVTIKFQP